MEFDVFGPFELTRHGSKKLLSKQTSIDLKKRLDAEQVRLAESCGCYVFARRAGKGYTPLYVGQACKRSILKEALNDTNLRKVNDVLGLNGQPVLFFIPMLTRATKRFRKVHKGKGTLPALDFLERWLIAEALAKNQNLINTRETKFLRGIHVTGIFNPKQGESTGESKKLKKALR